MDACPDYILIGDYNATTKDIQNPEARDSYFEIPFRKDLPDTLRSLYESYANEFMLHRSSILSKSYSRKVTPEQLFRSYINNSKDYSAALSAYLSLSLIERIMQICVSDINPTSRLNKSFKTKISERQFAQIWEKLIGVDVQLIEIESKSLYYCRSKSIQRAAFAGKMTDETTSEDKTIADIISANKYSECASCQ